MIGSATFSVSRQTFNALRLLVAAALRAHLRRVALLAFAILLRARICAIEAIRCTPSSSRRDTPRIRVQQRLRCS